MRQLPNIRGEALFIVLKVCPGVSDGPRLVSVSKDSEKDSKKDSTLSSCGQFKKLVLAGGLVFAAIPLRGLKTRHVRENEGVHAEDDDRTGTPTSPQSEIERSVDETPNDKRNCPIHRA
jgi:hypothetical protein